MATTGPPTSSIAFSVADFRIHALVDVVLHGFDNDDGIIDHQANGKHETEQRERVDRESERRKNDERSDERNRNREQRNQRSPPALQKDEDNDDHEAKRLKERQQYLVNAGRDGLGGVQRHAVSDAWRKCR